MVSHLEFLASDDLEGRYPGSSSDSVLFGYISREFEKAGLKAFGDNYIQEFEFLSGIQPDSSNRVFYNAHEFIQEKDFYPLTFSGSGEISAPIEFCGYGFDFETPENARNDYKSLDLQGKWALILRGEPENHDDFMERSRDRDKALLAMEKGAAGVLLVSGKDYSASDDLDMSLNREPEIDIPVVQLKRAALDQILETSEWSTEKLQEASARGQNPDLETEEDLHARIKIDKLYSKTGNVVGYLEGTRTDPETWIVIGAHHDHLGMGGKGSSSRMPDTIAIHNGADDNASGVAAVIELAEYFSDKKHRTSAGLIFVTFGAEEKGLLGSRKFTEDPPVDLSEIEYMVNLDMIGRMREDSSLQIGGVGTSSVGQEILDSLNNHYGLKLSVTKAGYGPSDHASFYAHNIPVYFLSTGAHQDYHTPFDDADSINYDGLVLSTEFTADLTELIDSQDSIPEFTEAGPKTNTSRSYRNRITLGIMPDVSGENKDGMLVLAVTEGRPADLGGMKKGDIITAIDGDSVANVYDYMYRLNKLSAGDRVVVTVLRDNKKIDLLIQL